LVGKATHAEGIDPASRELDGERNAIESAAYLGDGGRVGVGQLESVKAKRCALDEELERRVCEPFGSRDVGRVRWGSQRRQTYDRLPLASQGFPTGCQDAHP